MARLSQLWLVFCILILSVAATTAQQESIPQKPPHGTFLGKVVLEEPAGISDLVLKITSCAPQNEMQRYEDVLSHRKTGQEELGDLLQRHAEVGQYRLGTGVESGTALAYGIRLASCEATRKGFHIVAVASRFTLSQGRRAGPNPKDFHFTVFTLDVDAAGKGDGVFTDGAKLRFNKKHRLELSDNLENPLPVVGVHLDPQ